MKLFGFKQRTGDLAKDLRIAQHFHTRRTIRFPFAFRPAPPREAEYTLKQPKTRSRRDGVIRCHQLRRGRKRSDPLPSCAATRPAPPRFRRRGDGAAGSRWKFQASLGREDPRSPRDAPAGAKGFPHRLQRTRETPPRGAKAAPELASPLRSREASEGRPAPPGLRGGEAPSWKPPASPPTPPAGPRPGVAARPSPTPPCSRRAGDRGLASLRPLPKG